METRARAQIHTNTDTRYTRTHKEYYIVVDVLRLLNRERDHRRLEIARVPTRRVSDRVIHVSMIFIIFYNSVYRVCVFCRDYPRFSLPR